MEKIIKRKKPSKKEIEQLRQVTRNLEIDDVRLVGIECTAKGNREELSRADLLNISFSPKISGFKEGLLTINIEFMVEVSKKAGKKKAQAKLEANGEFELTYHVNEEKIEGTEGLKIFAFHNAPMHAWPYLRELMQNLGSRMGMPYLLIPVLPPGERASAKQYHRVAEAIEET